MPEFLNLKPETFGLDVSELSLKIVKLRKKAGFSSLASFGESKIKQGAIEGGEIKDQDGLVENLKEAVKNVKGEKLKTQYIVASLPEEKAFLRVIQMPVMEEKELKKAAYFEAENYIPMPLEKVYLDSQIIAGAEKSSRMLDVLIVAFPKEVADCYLSVFRKAGLKPTAFEVESQAISRALIKKETKDRSLLLIDLGATRTGLSFFSKKSLRFTATVAAVSENFSTEDLVNEIRKHLNYYKSSESKELAEVLLCGSRANSKDLQDLLSRELAIKVSLGNPWVNILPEPIKEIPELSFEDSLGYATALGLALYDKFTADTI